MLEIENLSVFYPRSPEIKALDRVSFSLKKGENSGVIGESGCGKSTLALAIMGLLENVRITGDIRYKGRSLMDLKPYQLREIRWRSIAVVFQNSLEVLNPVMTIGEQIGEPIQTHFSLTAKEIDERVRALMSLTGLSPEWRHRYPHQLSGGMRQRALLSMAVSCDPEFLIIDEPTTALDQESAVEILGLIETLQKKMGFSILMISHNLMAIRRMTSELITLYGGQVVEQGPTKEVLREPLHTYTRGLLNASPDFFMYKDLWGIRGEPPSGAEVSGCAFYPRCTQATDACRKSRPVLKEVADHRKVACHKGGIETFLTASGVSKTYPLNGKTVSALKGVDLRIRSGEVAALVGKSGSGKSTLANIIVSVIRPDAGKIRFLKEDTAKDRATNRMNGMQIVFQDPFSAISSRMKVSDVVCEPLTIMKWETPEARKERVREAMAMVHLPTSIDFMNRSAHSLSGGQRQRLSIARALVTDPKLLIADEITSMLDPSTRANILRELKGIQNRRGFAMLYITHDLYLARKVADRIYVMARGLIVEQGASFEVLENPVHPVTKALIRAAIEDKDGHHRHMHPHLHGDGAHMHDHDHGHEHEHHKRKNK